jgi:hypothetical protein
MITSLHFTSPQNGAAGYRRAGRGRVFGALHGMMQSHPAPDDAGIIWTAWEEVDQN